MNTKHLIPAAVIALMLALLPTTARAQSALWPWFSGYVESVPVSASPTVQALWCRNNAGEFRINTCYQQHQRIEFMMSSDATEILWIRIYRDRLPLNFSMSSWIRGLRRKMGAPVTNSYDEILDVRSVSWNIHEADGARWVLTGSYQESSRSLVMEVARRH